MRPISADVAARRRPEPRRGAVLRARTAPPGSWFGRLTALLVAAACLTGVTAAPARAASGPEYFGTNVMTLGSVPQSKWGTFLGQLAAGQMNVDRMEVDWRGVEPTAPRGGVHTYNWTGPDLFLRVMAEQGLRAAPVFRFAPSWVRTATPAFPAGDELPPSHYADVARFIAAFAQRYGPGGAFWAAHPEFAPRPTLSYEIWNEINLDKYAWNGKADPVAYAGLIRAVRPVLKATQPGAVLLADLAWQDSTTDDAGVYPGYVAALAAAGGLADLDAMGFHPYAPDADTIFTLVRRLRAQLASAGFPAMPIYANEAGLPASLNGAGVQYAADIDPNGNLDHGFPSDGARASSLAFAGEALAQSDCGVEQFLPYSITGTETDQEPLHEGFMGLLRLADGSPTLTAQALQRASRRWVARFAPGGGGPPAPLAICGGGSSPDSSLLTIPITITGAGNGCVDMVDTYDGNPMESAQLMLTSLTGAPLATARSDAYGHARACVPDASGQGLFRAFATVPKAGTSGTVVCDVPGSGCPAGRSFALAGRETLSARTAVGYVDPPPAPAPPKALTAAERLALLARTCRWKLSASITKLALKKTAKSRATVRTLATCTQLPKGTAVRFLVTLKRKHAKKETRVRSVFVRTGKASTLTVIARMAAGDSIALTHVTDAVTGVPRIRDVVTVKTPKRRK